MDTPEVKAFGHRSEAAKQRELGKHGAIAAGKIQQELRSGEGLAPHDAIHMASPSRVEQDLPETLDRDSTVADGMAVRSVSGAGFGIDIRFVVGIEGERLPIVADERRSAMGQDDSRIVVEYPHAVFEVGPLIEIVMSGPLEQRSSR